MFTVRVPYDDPERRATPRPEYDSADVRLGADAAEITTEHWSDPPETAVVVDGEVHECSECGALWATEESLNAHQASH